MWKKLIEVAITCRGTLSVKSIWPPSKFSISHPKKLFLMNQVKHYNVFIYYTRRLEKKLDGNYTRMLRAILDRSWQQHPTRRRLYGHLPPITKTILWWRCRWCSRYRRRKGTRRHEFKSWTRLISFHIALIPLGKVWIQLFSLQLWVNSRTD